MGRETIILWWKLRTLMFACENLRSVLMHRLLHSLSQLNGFLKNHTKAKPLNFTRQCTMKLNHWKHADDASRWNWMRVGDVNVFHVIWCVNIVTFSGSLDSLSINKFRVIKKLYTLQCCDEPSWMTLVASAFGGRKSMRDKTIYHSIIKFNLMAFCDFGEWEMFFHVRMTLPRDLKLMILKCQFIVAKALSSVLSLN